MSDVLQLYPIPDDTDPYGPQGWKIVANMACAEFYEGYEGEDDMPKITQDFGKKITQKLNSTDAFALENFDKLPDSALVSVQVVRMIFGRSVPTIYRDIHLGLFPSPFCTGRHSSAWRVGALRELLKSYEVAF